MKLTHLKKIRVLFIFLYIIFLQIVLEAKTVKGIIVDKSTNQPVANSIVMLLEKGKINALGMADSLGMFSFDNLRLDKFTIHAKRFGYGEVYAGPFNISKLDTFKVVIKLEAQLILLDETVVTGKRENPSLSNFYKRRQEGTGSFLTRDEFKDRQLNYFTDVLRSVPGLIVLDNQDGLQIFFSRYRMYQSPSIYIDGIALDDPGMLNRLNPNDVEAVEFYKSSTYAPMQYNKGRAGGVILIWTR